MVRVRIVADPVLLVAAVPVGEHKQLAQPNEHMNYT